jgi:hypothetical protein
MANTTVDLYTNNMGEKISARYLDNGDNTYSGSVALRGDARTGCLKSIKVTLSAVPGAVTSVTLPAGVRGFRLYPDKDVRFAIDEDPAAEATSADAAIAANAFAVGGIAKASQWETRLLESYTTLRLRSAQASAVIEIEIF